MKAKPERTTKQFNLILKTIRKFPKKKYNLIDVGACKHILKKFLPKNINYKSLDYSGKQAYVVDLEKGKIPIKNETFDIVVCVETLEHLSHPHDIMKELLRIGKKDAVFIFSMPNEYNFLARLYFLFGRKTAMQKPFKVVSEHLHIHLPRVRDIIQFFSEYIKIEEIDYGWQSRSSMTNDLAYSIDHIINLIAKIYPNLFTRLVVVKGKQK